MDQITELTRVHIFLSHVHDGPPFMIIFPTVLLCLIIINSLIISLLKLCELRVVTHGANVSRLSIALPCCCCWFISFSYCLFAWIVLIKWLLEKFLAALIYIVKNLLVIIMELKHEHEFSLKCFLVFFNVHVPIELPTESTTACPINKPRKK